MFWKKSHQFAAEIIILFVGVSLNILIYMCANPVYVSV